MAAEPSTLQFTEGVVPSKHHGQRMSLAEYEALPEEKPYLEYWDGVVLQKAVGRRNHSWLQSEFAYLLAMYSREAGGEAGLEADIWFDGRGWLIPDLVYWAPGKDIGSKDRSLPPTLCIEIRSPGQSMAEQRRKCRDMQTNGVDVCWLIDPERRRAELFEGDRNGERLPDDGVLASAFLPGFELPLVQLWAALDA